MPLPAPDCRLGYTRDQLRKILSDALPAFDRWHVGQTGGMCDGRRYNPEALEYEPTGCGPHGFTVYRCDLERFVQGLGPLD